MTGAIVVSIGAILACGWGAAYLFATRAVVSGFGVRNVPRLDDAPDYKRRDPFTAPRTRSAVAPMAIFPFQRIALCSAAAPFGAKTAIAGEKRRLAIRFDLE